MNPDEHIIGIHQAIVSINLIEFIIKSIGKMFHFPSVSRMIADVKVPKDNMASAAVTDRQELIILKIIFLNLKLSHQTAIPNGLC